MNRTPSPGLNDLPVIEILLPDLPTRCAGLRVRAERLSPVGDTTGFHTKTGEIGRVVWFARSAGELRMIADIAGESRRTCLERLSPAMPAIVRCAGTAPDDPVTGNWAPDSSGRFSLRDESNPLPGLSL
jgi:hypothetical protein